MPQLQLHMLRVTAVAVIVSENMSIDIDIENVKAACLLHDMGNIIKFALSFFPEALEPKGLEYWESVKKEFIHKYGKNEHEATYKIIKKLKISKRVQELVHSVGFSKAEERFHDKDYAKKICMYSDHRVSPRGILSLKERINEGKKRYKKNKQVKHDIKDNLLSIKYENFSVKIEEQIFLKCNITPGDINDGIVNKRIPLLRNTEINGN